MSHSDGNTQINPLREDHFAEKTSLPSTSSGDGYTYIYGVDDEPYQKSMHIARVRGGNLGGIWEFFDKSNNRRVLFESGSDGALTGVANEYSVTPWKRRSSSCPDPEWK